MLRFVRNPVRSFGARPHAGTWLANLSLVALAMGSANGCKDDPSGDTSGEEAGTGEVGSEGTEGSESGSEASESATTSTTSEAGEAGEAESGEAETGESSDSGTTGTSPDWSFGDHFGLPNLDDDNQNGNADWFDSLEAADDDPRDMVIGASKFEGFDSGDQVRLTLSGDTGDVRLWHNGNPVIGDEGDGTPLTTYTFTPGGGDETFTIEFREYLAQAQLTLDHIDGADAVIDSDTIRLLASPLIINHHLQPSEQVYMVEINGGFGNNTAMRDGYAAVLGNAFVPVSQGQVGGDQWIQDEPEFATSSAPGGARLNTVIDSIRDRGLDNFPELYFGGEPDWSVGVWGSGQATSEDSFGNLEASPPVTVDGVEYPFGRIYYGNGSQLMNAGMRNFLASQKIQAPIELDTSFLCVGHVDEYMSMVADPTAPKGFRVLFADTTSGWALVDSMNASTSLPRYGQDYGYNTVGAIQGDSSLEMLNQNLQTTRLDPIREQLKTELGLTDEDFIMIPTVFETVNQCGGGTAALMPGTVNLIVSNPDGGAPTLFVPDPFMRPNGAAVGSDVFANDFVSRMPDGWDVVFLDNWDIYHTQLGEVHCGTNVTRTPIADWWDVGLHLLD